MTHKMLTKHRIYHLKGSIYICGKMLAMYIFSLCNICKRLDPLNNYINYFKTKLYVINELRKGHFEHEQNQRGTAKIAFTLHLPLPKQILSHVNVFNLD